MSTTTVKTLQRAALAAIALVTAAGSTIGAQAATSSVQQYVPADSAITAPGAPAPKQTAAVKPASENKTPSNPNAGN
jgi:hypothetical protein